MYQQANPQGADPNMGGNPGADAGQQAPHDDNVVDADFKVDDDK